jgi:hypothetical protein
MTKAYFILFSFKLFYGISTLFPADSGWLKDSYYISEEAFVGAFDWLVDFNDNIFSAFVIFRSATAVFLISPSLYSNAALSSLGIGSSLNSLIVSSYPLLGSQMKNTSSSSS